MADSARVTAAVFSSPAPTLFESPSIAFRAVPQDTPRVRASADTEPQSGCLESARAGQSLPRTAEPGATSSRCPHSRGRTLVDEVAFKLRD